MIDIPLLHQSHPITISHNMKTNAFIMSPLLTQVQAGSKLIFVFDESTTDHALTVGNHQFSATTVQMHIDPSKEVVQFHHNNKVVFSLDIV